MKRSRKSSRRHKIVTASEGWDEYRFLETAFVPVVTEEGMGPVIEEPESDFVLIHGVAVMNLCELPIRRDARKQVKVPGEKELIINGYLLATRPQLASWKAQVTIDVENFMRSKALVFNRLIPPSFRMLQFIREQQTPEAQVIADLRPFA